MSENRREALAWYACGVLILGAAAYSLAVLTPDLVAALFQFAAGITAVRCFRAAGRLWREERQ